MGEEEEVSIGVRADVGSDSRNSEVNDDRDGGPMTGSGSGSGDGKDWASGDQITGGILKFFKRVMDGRMAGGRRMAGERRMGHIFCG